MRFFYTLGVTVMILAFPSWFIAIVAGNTTAGAIGMLTFLLGVLLTAVGAAMDYRAQYVPSTELPVHEYIKPNPWETSEARSETEWPRP